MKIFALRRWCCRPPGVVLALLLTALLTALPYAVSVHAQDKDALKEAPREPVKEPISVGTGFFVSNAGHIVTAYHVIRGKSQVLIGPVDRKLWRVATVLKIDETNDIALLQARLERPPLSIAPWSEVPIGLEALVIGYPQPVVQGLSKKITQGIVNGERSESGENAQFQLSAEVQRGNSGGPVLSPDGLVIGVVRAKLNALSLAQKTGDISQNVNYGLKSSRLIEFLQSAGVPVQIQKPNLALQPRPYETFRKAEASIVAVVARNPDATPAAGSDGRGTPKDVQIQEKGGN